MKSKVFGIPIIREIKEKFNFKEEFLSPKSDPSARNDLKKFIQDINERIFISDDEKISFGEYSAVTLIFRLQKKIIERYFSKNSKDMFMEFEKYFRENFGSFKFDSLISEYSSSFYKSEESNLFIDLISIFLGNSNLAFSKYYFLFSKDVFDEEIYHSFSESINTFFESQPKISQYSQTLIPFLLEPSRRFPHSILEQLKFIKEYWREFIDNEMSDLFLNIDTISEENAGHFLGAGPTEIYDFDNQDYMEPENFTYDKNWMPNLILLAKNIFVWLHQLSLKYNKKISHLNEIPEEELLELAKNGFTGIWLIGLWERSKISKKIKELNGDKDAIASAYSLYEYKISNELGGDYSYEILKNKAKKYGLRIGCDMVPNHTGLDSKLISEHPDWFINVPYPPFPSYSFNSENLSYDQNFDIRIEDHYYEKTDAAVVFQYKNNRTGEIKYIYHGNDGTSFPWNDTAQLNYLLPEVREAVIQDIIKISKNFPIIRFDAAMTLAKKHIQRLWFPKPGEGGAIPSRSEHSLTQKEFDRLIPKEFWREVVDRVSVEAPDTLLLAEAFWMMEGYFVRTLGMHRVYNSAFMNMIKDEENAKYRQTIFNTIEFNPQILKRFVNFMSNPDEETAFAQFGDNDKFFGVTVLMATMPGLPMFAHGQIEGFKEKYGMEYKKPKMNESVNKYLYDRHRKEIFPILKKRYLFSNVENFLLFDFESYGNVIEDVFAYSNEFEGQYSLVIYNNKFSNYSGKIQNAKTIDENKNRIIKSLGQAWNLHNDNNYFVIFKDTITGLSFIRNSADIYQNGLHKNLRAYEYAVYIDIKEYRDNEEKIYSKLRNKLGDNGTFDIEKEKKLIALDPLINQFNNYLNLELILNLSKMNFEEFVKFQPELTSRIDFFISYFAKWMNVEISSKTIVDDIINDLKELFEIRERTDKHLFILIIWIFTRHFGKIINIMDYEQTTIMLLDDFGFSQQIESIIKTIEKFNSKLYTYEMIKFIISIEDISKTFNPKTIKKILLPIFKDEKIKRILLVNKYEDKLWFNKEAAENLMEFLILTAIIILNSAHNKKEKYAFIDIIKERLSECIKKSEYNYDKFISEIEQIKLL